MTSSLALIAAACLAAADAGATAAAPRVPAADMLVLLGGDAPDERDEEAGTAREDDAPKRPAAGIADLRSEERRPRLAGRRQALALGWHGASLFTRRDTHYTFHSASIGYLGSYGPRGPFVHVTALLPLQARQDGRVYATGDYYGRRSGGDLLAGWQWRWAVRRGEVELGPGVHATIIWLPGKTGYRDFSALPLGVGLASTARWKLATQVFSRPVVLGAYGAVAYDFYDPLRSDDLAHGVTSRVGMLLGLGGAP